MSDIAATVNLQPNWNPADPADRKARWLADKAERDAKYPRIAPDDIKPGDPATHYVGSDSYAAVVIDVERFKSGKRKGQIKAILAANADVNEDGTLTPRPHGNMIIDFAQDENGDPVAIFMPEYDRFLPREVTVTEMYWDDETGWPERREVTEIRFNERSNGKVAYWSSLRVGYAHNYRDPHF